MNRPYYTPTRPSPGGVHSPHAGRTPAREQPGSAAKPRRKPEWDGTNHDLKGMSLTRKELEQRRLSMRSKNKVDNLDPALREIDEELGLVPHRSAAAGGHDSAEHKGRSTAPIDENDPLNALFAPMTTPRRQSAARTPPFLLGQRQPRSAPARPMQPRAEAPLPMGATVGEVDFETEMRRLRLSGKERSRGPAAATMSRRSDDRAGWMQQGKPGSSSASRWELDRIAALVANILPRPSRRKTADIEDSDDEIASEADEFGTGEHLRIMEDLESSRSSSEALVKALEVIAANLKQQSEETMNSGNLLSTLTSEVAILQCAVQKLTDRIDSVEQNFEHAERDTEAIISRKLAEHFAEREGQKAEFVAQIDDEAWKDWVQSE